MMNQSWNPFVFDFFLELCRFRIHYKGMCAVAIDVVPTLQKQSRNDSLSEGNYRNTSDFIFFTQRMNKCIHFRMKKLRIIWRNIEIYLNQLYKSIDGLVHQYIGGCKSGNDI